MRNEMTAVTLTVVGAYIYGVLAVVGLFFMGVWANIPAVCVYALLCAGLSYLSQITNMQSVMYGHPGWERALILMALACVMWGAGVVVLLARLLSWM